MPLGERRRFIRPHPTAIPALSAVALLVPGATRAHEIIGAGSYVTLDPLVLAALAAATLGYGYGIARLWRRRAGCGVRPWQVCCFAAGLAVPALALIWPLDALSRLSFAAHMSQHMLLIAIAPPLLVLGAPLAPIGALPGARRVFDWFARAPWTWFARPPVAAGLHGATLWVWHAPGPFQAALGSNTVHALEHATLLGTGLLFWWSLLRAGRARASGYGAGTVLVLTMIMHTGLLGALLTFAPRPLYPFYGAGARALGLTPLEDQQLAGLIMWVPGGLLYLAAALAFAGAWLLHAERRSARLAGTLDNPVK